MKRVTILMLALTSSVTARAEVLSPGQYEYKGTVTMEGVPGSQPTPFSGKQCLTAQDLADGGQKAMTSNSGGSNPCTFTNYNTTGSTATWNMTCQTQAYQMTGGGSASYNATGYNVRSENQANMMGMPIKIVTALSGLRVGDCSQSTLGAVASAAVTVPTVATAPAAPSSAAPVVSSTASVPVVPTPTAATEASQGVLSNVSTGQAANAAVGVGMWAGSLAGVDPSTLSQVADATKLVNKVSNLTNLLKTDKNAQALANIKPRNDAQGKFLLPFKRDGQPTEWAGKALTASLAGAGAGVAAGQATDAAVSALSSAGGMFGSIAGSLFGGAAKEKAKTAAADTGAAMALGGWDTIRAGSDLSFDNLDQMIVYMHGHYGLSTEFIYPVAASLALYPEIKERFEPALKAHYGIQ